MTSPAHIRQRFDTLIFYFGLYRLLVDFIKDTNVCPYLRFKRSKIEGKIKVLQALKDRINWFDVLEEIYAYQAV